MTIEQARRILGKLALNLTDEQVTKHIEVAELLTNIFFTMPKRNVVTSIFPTSKVP